MTTLGLRDPGFIGGTSYTFSPPSDPYLSNVSLLIHANSGTGSRTVIDSSPNNFTVTPSNIAYISSSQSKFEGSSVYLGYKLAYGRAQLGIPHNAAFEFGSGDFTLEFFINIVEIAAENFTLYNKGGGIEISGDYFEGGRIFTYLRDNSSNFIFGDVSGQAITNISSHINTWCHYALCRSGNNFYIFWNGVLRHTFTSSAAIKSDTSPIYIAGTRITYLDEIRLTKGVARYTSAFNVPTTQFQGVTYPLIYTDRHYFPPNQTSTVGFRFPEPPVGFSISSITATGGTLSNLTAIDPKTYSATFTPSSTVANTAASITVGAGSYYDPFGAINVAKSEAFTINSPLSESKATSMLLHMDGSNNSTTFTDSSSYGVSFITVQNAKLSTTQSKFGGTSGAFLTAGDYIYTLSLSGITFGSGNFTVEAWIYPLNPTTNDVFGTERAICGMWSAVSPLGQAWMLYLDAGSLTFIANYPDDVIIFSIPGVITEERWYHVAVTRDGATMYCFIDGFLQATYNAGTGSINTFTNGFGIGGYSRGAGSTSATFYGYIDEVRITKGICRYNKDFIPSPQAFINPPPLTDFENYVSLLLHMDGSNGSTTVTDFSSNNLTVTAVGNAQISTAQSKFGGSSLSLVRSPSSYLTVSNSTGSLTFGTGDFTVECWVFLNTLPAGNGYPNSYWIVGGGPVNSNTGFDIAIGSTVLQVGLTSFASLNISVAHGLSSGVWHHIAVCRGGNTLYAFRNGTQLATANVTGVTADSLTSGIAISAAEPSGSTSGNFNGYIDELRISKGICRYTSGFTPSTTPFPDY